MPSDPPIRVPDPRHLLVRGVNWLGDAVMTTPALRRLRERFPDARITLLTHQKLCDLWQHHPAINNLITFSPNENPWTVGRRLGAEDFDTALILPNSPRSALEPWFARIPCRVGYARSWRTWLLTHPVPSRPGHFAMRKLSAAEVGQRVKQPPPPSGPGANVPPGPQAHQLHEYLYLGTAFGADPAPIAPQLSVTPAEVQAATRKFSLVTNATSSAQLLVLGLNAGAEYGPAKRWPAERFAAAAFEVQRLTGCQWLIFGGPGDKDLAGTVTAAIQDRQRSGQPGALAPLNLAGKTTLRELMALLKLCRVLLTNDTGPMHVAAALDTAVVVPFGSTSPELTGPGLPGDNRHRCLRAPVPCAPCFRPDCPIDLRCMTGTSVESVVQAVVKAAVE